MKAIIMKKNRCFLYLSLFCCLVCSSLTVRAQGKEETEPASASMLANVALPKGAERVLDKSLPPDITKMLASLVEAGGPQVKQGRNEVLAWRGKGYKKANAPQLVKQLATTLQGDGWEYKTAGDNPAITVLSVVKAKPAPRALVGLWVTADEALILAWTELLPNNDVSAAGPPEANTPAADEEATHQKPADMAADDTPATAPHVTTPAGATVLEVNSSTLSINVMKKEAPKLPAFPALAPKAGAVRGYVKDVNGKPLAGAKIGVRSTAVGGAYSGAEGQTDAKGYYEIQVPFGVAHFYNAGYTIDYGDGRAALGLYPADGELSSFASNAGGVENFVLMPYGIADRDAVQDDPKYLNNYYGGCVILSYDVSDEDATFGNNSSLPANAVVEFTLAPTSPLIDGSKGRIFIVRKNVGTFWGHLYIVNVPVATYKVSARIVGGGALKMKEVGPNGGKSFGIDPKEATGTANLELRPSTAKADMVTAAHGNWEQVSIALSR